uniref:ShKT domain-containing protein n=1 Tax=Ornithorhynchus anatinus TaxID=9258 RepID=F7BG16_ORNAN
MTMRKLIICLTVAAILPISILGVGPPRVPYEAISTVATRVQQEIVNKHNTLRRLVEPPAKNMLKMEWNEEAAQNARYWAEKCEVQHSPQPGRQIKDHSCGENLLFATYSLSWSDAIQIWYNESKNFQYGTGATKRGAMVSHYTQLVWSTSYQIGCGAANCPKEKSFQVLFICQYCHAGNDPETMNTPYKVGPPCGDCPKNCNNRLCTNPCPFADNASNCLEAIKALGCKHELTEAYCKASCKCTIEIK